MTGTDSDLNRREAQRADPYNYDLAVTKSVRGMTSQDESTWKQLVQRCTDTPPCDGKRKTANA